MFEHEIQMDVNDIAKGVRCLTNLATGFWRSCVLFAVQRLDLITAIDNRSVTALELSTDLSLNGQALERLLDACVNQELLNKEDGHYSCSEFAQVYLNRKSNAYIGDWIGHWADMLAKGNWQHLDDAVRTGMPLRAANPGYGSDARKDPLHHWIDGMHEVALAGHAKLLADLVSLKDARTLLDVGGGPGTYSVHFCNEFPLLSATIVDASDILEITKNNVSVAGLSDRIECIDADFRNAQLHRRFDAVLLSNVLHMFAASDAELVLRNAYAHLKDDGQLIVQEWIIDDDGTGPDYACLFNLHILINPGGEVFRWPRLSELLTTTGFSVKARHQTTGLYEIVLAGKTG